MPPEPPARIIPLLPGISRSGRERRAMLRAAVIQVVRHLVVRAVPPPQRVPLFDRCRTYGEDPDVDLNNANH